MAKTDKKVEEARNETVFTHRRVIASHTRTPRFVSVCPKCNN